MNEKLFPHGRFLISSPTMSYDVVYRINDWMHPGRNTVDKDKAIEQWEELRNTISRLGGYTEIISIPHPDGVFSANSGLAYNHKFILSSFKHEERQPEEDYWMNWAKGVPNPDNPFTRLFDSIHIINVPFEGAGDALFANGTLYCGYGFRTALSASAQLSEILSVPVTTLKLTSPKFYHLDTCFCPLDVKEVMYFPGAFDDRCVKIIEDRFDTVRVGQADAPHFACNSVVLGKDVIIPAKCSHTMTLLRKKGYTCHPIEMSEFIKSGGACKCLTLRYA